MSAGERACLLVGLLAFTLAPALLWVLVYIMAINAQKTR